VRRILREATAELIERYSDDVHRWLEEIATPECPAVHIAANLKRARLSMWFCYTGNGRLIGIVLVGQTSNGVLTFFGAAGDVMNEWATLDADFVALAKAKGCGSYEFRGRRGFLRTFKQFGMREKYTVMERVIDA